MDFIFINKLNKFVLFMIFHIIIFYYQLYIANFILPTLYYQLYITNFILPTLYYQLYII